MTNLWQYRGKDYEVGPMNLGGVKALLRVQIEAKEKGTDATLSNMEVFAELAFHALRGHGFTREQIEGLTIPEIKSLTEALGKANRPEGSDFPKAPATSPA